MTTPDTIRAKLGPIAGLADEAIAVAEAALLLASIDHPASDLRVYRDHLKILADAVNDAATTLDLSAHAAAPEAMAGVLGRVLAGEFRYIGDEETYDDLDNANLMRVIERRKGLPVTLGILYLSVARAQGWAAAGLSFPGHFLIRLESRDGRRVIVDPFHGGRIMEVQALRELLKQFAGTATELDASHYRPVSNRDVLVRLQNNVRTRRLELGEVDGALGAVTALQVLDPDNIALWREAGVLHMRLGHLKHAVESFETFVARSPEGPDKRKISQVVQELRERLH